jgi:hypothetical protein
MNIATTFTIVGRVANPVRLVKQKKKPMVQILLYVNDEYRAKLVPLIAQGTLAYNFAKQIRQGNLIQVSCGLNTLPAENGGISLSLVATLEEFKPLETKFQRHYYEGDKQKISYLFPRVPQNFKRQQKKIEATNVPRTKKELANSPVTTTAQPLKTESSNNPGLKTEFKTKDAQFRAKQQKQNKESWLDELGAITSFGFPQMQ